jgi:hypothetical protein
LNILGKRLGKSPDENFLFLGLSISEIEDEIVSLFNCLYSRGKSRFYDFDYLLSISW